MTPDHTKAPMNTNLLSFGLSDHDVLDTRGIDWSKLSTDPAHPMQPPEMPARYVREIDGKQLWSDSPNGPWRAARVPMKRRED